MPRFAANLSFLYNEVPFLERFAAASRDGFRGVEFVSPYEYAPAVVAAAARDAGVEVVLINTALGRWDEGERGLAALPGREADCREWIERGLVYARALGCPRMHVMAGIVPAGVERSAMRASFVQNLRAAAPLAARAGVTLLLEPINQRDLPGYFLSTQADAHSIVADVGAPNVKVQMDFYHCQIVEGDLAQTLREHFPRVGHVQIAGVPGRHEPDVGEINYPYLFALLDELGYDGWVSAEYRPRAGTSAGLGWMAAAAAAAVARQAPAQPSA